MSRRGRATRHVDGTRRVQRRLPLALSLLRRRLSLHLWRPSLRKTPAPGPLVARKMREALTLHCSSSTALLRHGPVPVLTAASSQAGVTHRCAGAPRSLLPFIGYLASSLFRACVGAGAWVGEGARAGARVNISLSRSLRTSLPASRRPVPPAFDTTSVRRSGS